MFWKKEMFCMPKMRVITFRRYFSTVIPSIKKIPIPLPHASLKKQPLRPLLPKISLIINNSPLPFVREKTKKNTAFLNSC